MLKTPWLAGGLGARDLAGELVERGAPALARAGRGAGEVGVEEIVALAHGHAGLVAFSREIDDRVDAEARLAAHLDLHREGEARGRRHLLEGAAAEDDPGRRAYA